LASAFAGIYLFLILGGMMLIGGFLTAYILKFFKVCTLILIVHIIFFIFLSKIILNNLK
jgi:hypothetical protein